MLTFAIFLIYFTTVISLFIYYICIFFKTTSAKRTQECFSNESQKRIVYIMCMCLLFVVMCQGLSIPDISQTCTSAVLVNVSLLCSRLQDNFRYIAASLQSFCLSNIDMSGHLTCTSGKCWIHFHIMLQVRQWSLYSGM